MAHSTESWEVQGYGCGIWQEINLLLYPMAGRKAQKTETKKRVIAFTTSPLKTTAPFPQWP